MDESYFREKLSAYFDKSLSPEEMAMMDEYVQKSEEAQRILEEYRKLERFIAEKSGLGGDEDYWERSAKRIEQAVDKAEITPVTPVKPKSRGWLWKAVPIAASIMLLTFIGLHQSEIFRWDYTLEPTEKEKVMEIGLPPSLLPGSDTAEAKKDTDALDEETEARPLKVIVDTGPVDPGVGEVESHTEPKIGIPAPVPDEETFDAAPRPTLHQDVSETAPDATELPSVIDKRERSPELIQSAESAEQSSIRGDIRPTGMETVLSDSATVRDVVDEDVVEELDELQQKLKSRLQDVSDSNQEVFRALAPEDESKIVSSFADGDHRIPKDKFLKMLSSLPLREGSEIDTVVPEYTKEELDRLLVRHRAQRERVTAQLADDSSDDPDYKKDAKPSKKGSPKVAASPSVDEYELKRQLYESCYYVALATEDEEEFVDAIVILDECARDYSNPYRNLARDYLDMLNRYLEAQH